MWMVVTRAMIEANHYINISEALKMFLVLLFKVMGLAEKTILLI